MMEGNPNLWNLKNMMRSSTPICSSLIDMNQQHTTASASDSDSNSNIYADHGQEEFPQSWSQLLMGGMANDQEEVHPSTDQLQGIKNMDEETNNWDRYQYHHETSLNIPLSNLRFLDDVDAKESVIVAAPSIMVDDEVQYGIGRDNNSSCYIINNNRKDIDQQQRETLMVDIDDHSTTTTDHVKYDHISSPLGILSDAKKSVSRKQQITEQAAGSNYKKMVMSGGNGTGVYKKPRVQSSISQPPLRVRKELGDRITALHQIVCPFGKTDTASVLLEAIGYVRFLQGQIQALSSPYFDMSSGISSNNISHFHPLSVQGERNYAFHDFDQEMDSAVKVDLRSRGLCLVPISCINNNIYININESGMRAADFWVTPPPNLAAGSTTGGGGGFSS